MCIKYLYKDGHKDLTTSMNLDRAEYTLGK